MTKFKVKGIAVIIIAGILWGNTGLFVRNLSKMGLNSTEISTMRLTLTFLLFLSTVLIFKRDLLKIRIRDIWIFAGAGLCGIIGSSLFYFYSINLTSMSVAAVLMYTSPAIVIILSVILFREKLTYMKVTSCILALAGAALVSGITGGGVKFSLLGIVFGLLAGFSYALYSIFSTYAIRAGYKSLTITVYSFAFAVLGIMFLNDAPALYNKITADYRIIPVAFGQALLTCFAPYLLYTIGLSKCDASKASIISTIEPVVATIMGFAVFGESISVAGYLGILFVLGSIILLNIKLPEFNFRIIAIFKEKYLLTNKK